MDVPDGADAPAGARVAPVGAGERVMATPTAFEDELAALGFRLQGASRRGGRMWSLVLNRFLTFVLHDYDGTVVLTWSFALGEYLEQRGWRTSVTDASVVEVFPRADVRLPVDIDAVGAEITRVLASLRLDLGDPSL